MNEELKAVLYLIIKIQEGLAPGSFRVGRQAMNRIERILQKPYREIPGHESCG